MIWRPWTGVIGVPSVSPELVGGAGAPARDDPGEQHGADVAQGGVVMLALVDHEAVVAGGEGGVGAPGLVGGHEQGLAQRASPA